MAGPTGGGSAVPSPPSTRAVFVDRDGTLNPDLHYLADSERLEVFRGVAEGIRLLRSHGYRVICVTNQSGIERGFYTVPDVERIHERLNAILRPRGAQVDAFYYCPHAPETHCGCRKPGVELFERARADHGVQFSASAIVGDRELDIEAGDRLGLVTVLVPRPATAGDVERDLKARGLHADLRAPSFRSAALTLLNRG